MKVESIAECSKGSILQYFWPALSDNWAWKPIWGLFESGPFTQALLYATIYVCADALCPNQQVFIHVRKITCLPALNQHQAEDKVSCSRTQYNPSGDSWTSHPWFTNLTLYQWATALLYTTSTYIYGWKWQVIYFSCDKKPLSCQYFFVLKMLSAYSGMRTVSHSQSGKYVSWLQNGEKTIFKSLINGLK